MHLLGKCPKCGEFDGIIQHRPAKKFNSVQCQHCLTEWDDWSILKHLEKEKGNRLIPISINKGSIYVKLWYQALDEIPWYQLIVETFNAALITKFQLGVCLATEGGVEGIVKEKSSEKKEYVELRNEYGRLGLYAEPRWRDKEGQIVLNDATKKCLKFYVDLMDTLFLSKLSYEGRTYQMAEWMFHSEAEGWNILVAMLTATLIKVGGKKFPEKLKQTLQGIRKNPLERLYLKGLSDEDIACLFVPPPWFP